MRRTDITLDTPMEATSATIGLAIFLILLGLTAIFVPLAVGIAVGMLILWVIVRGGARPRLYHPPECLNAPRGLPKTIRRERL